MCSHLYCGEGVPLASQVRVASSSMESTGMNKSPGSILHLGPWYDPLSRQSVRETTTVWAKRQRQGGNVDRVRPSLFFWRKFNRLEIHYVSWHLEVLQKFKCIPMNKPICPPPIQCRNSTFFTNKKTPTFSNGRKKKETNYTFKLLIVKLLHIIRRLFSMSVVLDE